MTNNISSIAGLRKTSKVIAQANNVKGAIVITYNKDGEEEKISIGTNGLNHEEFRHCMCVAIHSSFKIGK